MPPHSGLCPWRPEDTLFGTKGNTRKWIHCMGAETSWSKVRNMLAVCIKMYSKFLHLYSTSLDNRDEKLDAVGNRFIVYLIELKPNHFRCMKKLSRTCTFWELLLLKTNFKMVSQKPSSIWRRWTSYSESVCMATVSVYHHRLTSRFGCWLETSKVWWLQWNEILHAWVLIFMGFKILWISWRLLIHEKLLNFVYYPTKI